LYKGLEMSICQSGVDVIIQPGRVLVDISDKHPLIQLGKTLPWRELIEIILPDLKRRVQAVGS
jgi:hypothetical protein